jgi:hypothetical protein
LVASLTADNAALRAELARRDAQPEKPIKWIALKAADHGQYTYETVRAWCVAGNIDAQRRGARWFVNEASLSARLASLAAS